MAILWTNDGWVTTLEQKIADLQTQINNLTAQLPNYSTSTLEWTQAIDAINNRVNVYQQAINEYKSLISWVKNAATEAKQWSVQKQQAKQWYIWGLATKRWMTHAEALKDIADVEAVWRGERSEIRSQEQENLASAKWGLSNLYMDIVKQEAEIAAAWGWSSSWYSSWKWKLSSALSSYSTTPSSWITKDQFDWMMWQSTDDTLTKAWAETLWAKNKRKGSFLDIYKILPYMDPGPMGMVARWAAVYNIFKKLNK